MREGKDYVSLFVRLLPKEPMPVTVTSNPEVFRVSFVTTELIGGRPGRHEVEISCLLRLVPTGIEIVYVHHHFRVRSGALGAFESEETRRMEMTPTLAAAIETGVKEQFWSKFYTSIVPLTYAEEPEDLTNLFLEDNA